jgi:predicted metalloprotease with PDZ domain
VEFDAHRAETELRLPAWRPGRYLLQNYAANVRDWVATGSDGRELEVRKSDKSSWIVRSRVGESVSFSYAFYAGILDAGSSFLDESEAYFNGSNLFVMVADRRRGACELRLKVPRGWNVRTQLKRSSANRFLARDYDHLIDSPTLISPTLVEEAFEHDRKPVSLVFQNAEGLDTAQFVEPTRAVVAAQCELFGEIPFDRYFFLYHVGAMWHGVEHEDSSSIILKRSEMIGSKPGDKGHDRFLGITAHEFFHVWNVKRLLPRAFVPYDYSTEVNTRLLWLMEGVTSYYAEKTLLRSRLWTLERYLQHLTEQITAIEDLPGQQVISVAQASFDAWLQDPQQMHDKPNVWVSFYTKGEVVGALLDLEIIALTRGRRSLDDVMRLLWRKYGRNGRGVSEEEVVAAASQIAGSDLAEFFARYVDGRDLLPYDAGFSVAGIEVKSPEGAKRWTGCRFKSSGGSLLVDFAITGSPAARAGLLPNDEILAVNGVRVRSAAEAERQVAISEGEVTFTTARNDLVGTRVITPVPDPSRRIQLSVLADPAPEQLRMRTVWVEGSRR